MIHYQTRAMTSALRLAVLGALFGSAHSSGIHSGSFMPLSCNADLSNAACTVWSSKSFDLSSTVTVPCGECVTVDVAGDLNLAAGLNVVGKLVFPSTRSTLTITTPFIFVQGELVVEELVSPVIPSPDSKLRVKLVGTDGVTLTTHPLQSHMKCASGCSVGKKPIVVAGGSLNVNGMPDTCPTWSRLSAADVLAAPPRAGAQAPVPPAGCSAVIVDATFDGVTGAVSGWDGMGSGVVGAQEGFYRVFQRTSSVYGPRVQIPVACVVPGAHYSVRFEYRYEAGVDVGIYKREPYLRLLRKDAVTGSTDWTAPQEVFGRGNIAAVDAGVWYSTERTVSFTAQMTDPDATSSLEFYISPYVDESVGIDVDNVRVTLVSVDPAATCGSALSNSDTVSYNGAAYPFFSTGGSFVAVTTQGAPAFFRSSLRTSEYDMVLSQQLATACVQSHAVYEFTGLVRADIATSVSIAVWLDQEAGDRFYASVGSCEVVGGAGFAVCKGYVTFTPEQVERL
eukprot:Hpha_TRINITY_DN5169_c0_g2::TRINITY_DN5169_c0_g2_i1::g.193063::m.193063